MKNLNKNLKGMTIGIPKEYFIEGINDEVETSELDNYLHGLEHQEILVEEIPAGIEDVFMNMQTSIQSQSQ